MQRLVTGVAAGFVGTVAMTAAMVAMFRLLPRSQQAPLPPRQITEQVLTRVGVEHLLDEQDRFGATMLAHFLYGSLVGAMYLETAQRLPLPPFAKGGLFGLAVWGGSYEGWVPAVRLLPAASQWPHARNVLMIVAHVVWGVTIASVTRWAERGSMSAGPRPE